MGRRSHSSALAVWMNGEHVGTWITAPNGTQSFAYDDTWTASPRGRPISLSLPLLPSSEPHAGAVVESFFDNLLPDNREIRTRLRTRFRANSANAFDLLTEVGRDCVGALQILPEDAERPDITTIAGKPLQSGEVEQAILNSLGSTFGATSEDDYFRLSLAGAQEKTAFLRHNEAWCEPLGATPSTHIFKLPIGNIPQGLDLSTSVENEWLCSRLVCAFGIPIAPCSIAHFGAQKVLIVERFDRKLSDDGRYWLRIPQEDFCQVTGMPSAKKYEKDGGPGIRQIMGILSNSETPDSDRLDFFRTQIVYWLLAGIDGHAKNFSIFLLPGGGFRLAPRYDVLSIHGHVGTRPGQLIARRIKMAMAVSGKNVHYRWDEIEARHWLRTGARVGLADTKLHIERILAEVPAAIELVRSQIPSGFPLQLADSILEGLSNAREQMARQLG